MPSWGRMTMTHPVRLRLYLYPQRHILVTAGQARLPSCVAEYPVRIFCFHRSGDYAAVGAYYDTTRVNPASPIPLSPQRHILVPAVQARCCRCQPTVTNFGYSVSISGDYAVVGAPANRNDDGATALPASAYVFKIVAPSKMPRSLPTMRPTVIGSEAPYPSPVIMPWWGSKFDDDVGLNSGSAYIFIRDGTSWSQQAKIVADDAAEGDRFGYSVAIVGDYAIVGAYFDDDAGNSSGAAYIFTRSGTSWSQQAKIVASDAGVDDYFGISVAISGDYAVVGAGGDDDGGTDSGAAYIFTRSGTSWSQQAKIVADDAAASDWFGYSVAIDGDYAVVGAYLDTDAGGASGSAYIFIRSGTSWSQQAKIVADDAAADDWFGSSVAISGDYAIAGSLYDDDGGTDSGAAYIFVRSGTSWSQQAKIVADDALAGDRFGNSVAIAGDYALVGAQFDDNTGSFSGSAYIFIRSGTSWSHYTKLVADDAAGGDEFGSSVAISGDYVIAGGAL